jgi:sialic acid synthase SpsE
VRIKINDRFIGDNYPVFLVAEAGINHNGNVKIAKKMVLEAKYAGADAIKFQTFRADNLAAPDSKFYKVFKKVELDKSDFGEISDFAKSNEIVFFSTPFSEEAVDILSSLKVPMFKISSGDLTHLPLLEYVSKKKKPIIISTGMADLYEIDAAVNTIQRNGNNKIIVLHSVSAYPTPISDANIRVISTLKNKFAYPIGYSDNGSGTTVPLIAVAMGAVLIEKHFTLSKKMNGPDHSFSADPLEFSTLSKLIRETETILGNGKKFCQPSEKENRILARRSIVAKKNIPKNVQIMNGIITFKRPGTGIPPSYLKKVLGKRTKRAIKINFPLRWQDLS